MDPESAFLSEEEGPQAFFKLPTPSDASENMSSSRSSSGVVTARGNSFAQSDPSTSSNSDSSDDNVRRSMEERNVDLGADDLDGLDDLMGGVQIMLEGKMCGLTQDRISELTKERDAWKGRADEYRERISVLEKRLASGAAKTDPDVIARLNLLEREKQRLESVNINLKEDLQDAKRANTLLCDNNEGKSRKLRGANKKAKNAKDVAAKEEEKAKVAQHEKNERLKHEREMRKELKAAQAEISKKDKIIQGLRADLHIEKTGYPHLRDDDAVADETTAAFSVQFRIHRAHFQKFRPGLEHYQMAIINRLKGEYAQWRKPQEEKRVVVGATYVDAPDTKMEVDFNEDVVEMPCTGAEHDGRRSKRGLGALARRAMAAHNSSS